MLADITDLDRDVTVSAFPTTAKPKAGSDLANSSIEGITPLIPAKHAIAHQLSGGDLFYTVIGEHYVTHALTH